MNIMSNNYSTPANPTVGIVASLACDAATLSASDVAVLFFSGVVAGCVDYVLIDPNIRFYYNK